MLSFSKILLTLLVVGGVLFLAWAVARRGAGARVRGSQRRRVPGAVDMEACPVCGIFMAPGGKACGRPNCPYTG